MQLILNPVLFADTIQETTTFTLNYKGTDVECDKATGKVVDRTQLAFPAEAVVQFQGGTDSPDWKDLKVCVDCVVTPKPARR